MNPSLIYPIGERQVNGQILFFLIYRMHREADRPGGPHIWKPSYKSEIKSQSHSRQHLLFEFNQVVLMKSDMCGDDEAKDVKVEFFISQKNGRHKNIGSVNFNIQEIRENMDQL